MPTRVQLPDGSIGEFPDSMSQQQIQAVLQKQFPPPKASPPNSVTGGAGRRTVAIGKGLAQTFGPPKSPLDYFAGPALPLLRMGEGAVQSGIAAGKQAWQQAKEAHSIAPGNKALKTLGYAHALTTGLAAIDPFASGTVTNANDLEAQGRSREAVGQAIPDLLLLAGPKVISPALRRGAEMISGTGTKAAETLAKDTAEANKAAEAKASSARDVEAKRTAHQNTITEKTKELQGRIETARNNALKEGNEKYSTVREALNPIPADMEKIHGLYHEARESLGETQVEPALLKRLGTALEHGEELSYKDLQSMYSELGKELSKGTLPGGTYHAYDVLQDGIGNDMQRIADANGQGAELTEARNYWRRMKQTFGKPMSVRDVASKTLRTISPEAARAAELENRIRLLSHYDPEIGNVSGEVTKAREGLKGLPKPKPTEATKTTISPEAVKNAKTDAMLTRAGHIAGRGSLIATWPLYHVFSAIAKGAPGEIGTMGMESGATLAGVQAVARILRNPSAVEFLSKATARDVAAIPPELRSGNWQAVIDGAKKQGIPVSPAILALANHPRHPIFSAKSPLNGRKYIHNATNAQGHRIGSNDGQTWYDVQSGQQVQ